jgi:penicillin-binding protein 2
MRISGKTGTAQVKNAQGALVNHIVWFISFAPYEQPRYAVVAMIEGGSSGARDCAPIAQKIYTAILEHERSSAKTPQTLAQNH